MDMRVLESDAKKLARRPCLVLYLLFPAHANDVPLRVTLRIIIWVTRQRGTSRAGEAANQAFQAFFKL